MSTVQRFPWIFIHLRNHPEKYFFKFLSAINYICMVGEQCHPHAWMPAAKICIPANSARPADATVLSMSYSMGTCSPSRYQPCSNHGFLRNQEKEGRGGSLVPVTTCFYPSCVCVCVSVSAKRRMDVCSLPSERVRGRPCLPQHLVILVRQHYGVCLGEHAL